MIDAINRDYVRTARAKGLSENWVIRKHALRNALLPVIDQHRARAAVPVRRRHRRPRRSSAGRAWAGHSSRRPANFDYPVLMGILVVTAVIVVFANLLADVIYGIADPRISYG